MQQCIASKFAWRIPNFWAKDFKDIKCYNFKIWDTGRPSMVNFWWKSSISWCRNQDEKLQKSCYSCQTLTADQVGSTPSPRHLREVSMSGMKWYWKQQHHEVDSYCHNSKSKGIANFIVKFLRSILTTFFEILATHQTLNVISICGKLHILDGWPGSFGGKSLFVWSL